MPVNQQQLIQQARRGDQTAWTEIISLYQEAVFRLAYLIVGDAHEAEDVAQDVFIRAMRYLPRFDAERPLKPWLLQITRNLARNRNRAASRYFQAITRLQHRHSPSLPVEQQVAAADKNQRLWWAIQQLRKSDQEVIYLRFFLDLPVADTAEILGVAQGTVKSRLYRALDRLQVVIERDFSDLKAAFNYE